MIKRKLEEIGSILYRTFIFPFRRLGCEVRTGSVMKQGSYVNKGTVLCGKNYVGKNTVLSNVVLGYGSYVTDNGKLNDIVIGKYCSIAPGFKCIGGIHPTEKFVSTHPAFFSTNNVTPLKYVNKQKFEENKYIDIEISDINNAKNIVNSISSNDNRNLNSNSVFAENNAKSNSNNSNIKISNKYSYKIGNDVWIGTDVSIMQGVTIGDGCIVGANSLVTADLEPYGIYAGTPVRLIRKRFPDAQIARLTQIRWWDKGEAWIRENADKFDDINVFLDETAP